MLLSHIDLLAIKSIRYINWTECTERQDHECGHNKYYVLRKRAEVITTWDVRYDTSIQKRRRASILMKEETCRQRRTGCCISRRFLTMQ